MTDRQDDFYEDDEPVDDVVAAFQGGPHGITQPIEPMAATQLVESRYFRVLTPVVPTKRAQEYAQA